MDVREFENTGPELALEDYFLGRTQAWGVFQSKLLGVHRQFTVDIEGRVEDGVLTLTEDFVYTDGETDRRVWTIRRTGDHTYEGRADDVVGVAEGSAFGNALQWSYTMELPFRGGTTTVRFDDWMFLQDDDTLLNRARVSKFGLTVGEVTLFFRRAEESQPDSARLPRPASKIDLLIAQACRANGIDHAAASAPAE